MNNKQRNYLMIVLVIGWLITIQHDCAAQTESSLQGTWINEPGTRKADFYREGNAWFGKLTWAEDGSKVKAGDIIFRDLIWNENGFNGKAVTPRGKALCTILFEGNDKVKITGSKGGMSKSVYWTRVK